jgi:hypothetical protein
MSKVKPEHISIFKVQVYKSAVDTSIEYLEKPIKPGNFRVGFSQNAAFNLELKNVRIRIETALDGVDVEEKSVGIHGVFGIEFHFHIDNFEDFIEGEDEPKKINNILLETLLSIAYSTTRGIVIERTQGTHLNGVILPIIAPKELTKGISEPTAPDKN